MKLIVQADDFAMTDALAEGIIKCAKDGILTQTGLMTNGPHAEYYARKIMEECPHIALGQEINLVSGRPISDPKDIPSLVDENGVLIRSVVHKEMDLTDWHHTRYEDSFREIDAQVAKYIEITGHKPYFIGLHSYHNEEMMKAMNDVQDKYDIHDHEKVYQEIGLKPQMGPWYPLKNAIIKEGEPVKNDSAEVTSLDYQINFDAVEMFLNGQCGYITDYVNDPDKVTMLHTHAGYIDKELISMSTLKTTRLVELNLLTSDKIKQWIKDNNVELVNMRDLFEERGISVEVK